MASKHYPTVSATFIIEKLIHSGKVNPDTQLKVGKSTSFNLIGNKPLHKKLITLREDVNGEISYMQATGLAAVFGFMGDLLIWCKDNRNWIEGGYSARQQQRQILETEEAEEE